MSEIRKYTVLVDTDIASSLFVEQKGKSMKEAPNSEHYQGYGKDSFLGQPYWPVKLLSHDKCKELLLMAKDRCWYCLNFHAILEMHCN